MGARDFEPVILPPARPDELVYSLTETADSQGTGQSTDESRCMRPSRRRLPKGSVTQADREMADNAIRNGTIKVTRCAPGYSAHIIPKVLKEL